MVGDKCVKDDSGNLSFDNEAKKVAWKQHYERLLNEEFSWNPEDLTADPVVGPPIHIDVEMVVKAITKMKTGKSAGPSGIVVEMLKALERGNYRGLKLLDHVMKGIDKE